MSGPKRQRACNHRRAGIVTTHPNGLPAKGAMAATDCCTREECIEYSIRWAAKKTSGLAAEFVPDRLPAPSVLVPEGGA